MPVQFTTTLPDVSQPSLGNGVEDEIAVSWTDVINYGDYRIEYRETSSSTWLSGPVVDESNTSANITGLEDGEEYEVQMRTETEHRTGSWTTETSIVTKFPGATNFSIDSTTDREVSMSWTDNSDNEDGFKVLRSENFDGTWGRYVEVLDEPSNTTSATDSSVYPNTEYRYKVRAYTEHTSADSGTATTTTNDDGVTPYRSKAQGWKVEVVHSDGTIHFPNIIGEPQRNPRLNGMPTITIPVTRNEKWQDDGFELAEMRVWYDGVRQPIGELADVVMQPDKTILEGRGGSELLKNVAVEYRSESVHAAAENIISNNTSYTANVDAPPNAVDENRQMESASTTTELQNNLVTTIDSNTPAEVKNGEVYTLQTCWTMDASADADSFDLETTGNDDLSNGDGTVHTSGGDSATFSFTNNYDIPEGDFDIGIRFDQTGSNIPSVDVYLDGNKIVSGINNNTGPGWTYASGWDDLSTLSVSSGSHTIEVRAQSDGGGDGWVVDVIAPHDTRYSYTFDNNLDSAQGYLDGPELYPDAYDFQFEQESVITSVTGGRVETTFDDTTNAQALGLRSEGADAYSTKSNASTYETDFSDGGPFIQFRATLSRHGSQSATPKTGIQSQSLQDYTLYADVDDTPLVVNRTFDGRIIDILKQLAQLGNFIFEYRREDGGESVEWTSPGQRAAGRSVDASRYSVRKTSKTIVEKATVKGNAQPVDGEVFTADVGNYVDLQQDDLVEGQEVVYDPDTGTEYEDGVDYVMENLSGRIKALSNGALSDSTDYEISYYHRPQETHAAEGVSDPLEDTFNLKSLTSDRGCGAAAVHLIDQLKNPQFRATVELPFDETGWTVVEDVQSPDIPTSNTRLQIQNVENQPGKTTLTLGNRGGVEQELQTLRNQIDQMSRF